MTTSFYTPNDVIFGKSFTQWTEKWWNWCMESPKAEITPSSDDSNVLFCWTGDHGDQLDRTIQIPSNKAILIPVMNFNTSYLEDPSLKTDSDLIKAAKDHIDNLVQKDCEFNGVPCQIHRIPTRVFDLQVKEGNPLKVPPGNTRGVSDGYWIFTKPLAPGNYDLAITGACTPGPSCVNVKYHIQVL